MAARLGVSQPTVAKMLKRPASLGFIQMILARRFSDAGRGEAGAGKPRAASNCRKFLLVLGVSPEIARRDAEGMEHHVSRRHWMPFGLHATAWNICRMNLAFYGRCGVTVFQLLIIVGMALSLFVPFAPRAGWRD